MATTKIADVIVPEIFGPYFQQITTEKSELIASGALVRSAALDAQLAGGGLTFNAPSFNDLANDADNVSTDDDTSDATPNKIGTAKEIAVRLSRNVVHSVMGLTGDLAGADPMAAIGNRIGSYWSRRHQAIFVATIKGIFADNAAAPGGTEHVQNDMTHDVSAGGYTPGKTDFHAAAFIKAAGTMGDSADTIKMVMMHSVVFQRAQINNLIDFIPDAVNPNAAAIPTFLGRRVIQDDGLPVTGQVYDTWLFGEGAVQLGVGSADVPVETERLPRSGDGGGQENLITRQQLVMHPVGNQYAGTAPNGGPSNAATTNNLADAGSWLRVFAERNQIKIARLITKEA